MKKHTLKKLVSIALGIASLSTPALADDPSSDWSGPYMGLHGGYEWGNLRNNPSVPGPVGPADSFMGGGQVGNNWQYNHLVWGIEGDASALDVNSTNANSTIHEDWMTTFRGRLGYSVNHVLPYATAGLGLTDVDLKAPGLGSTSNVDPGIAAGGGMDFRLADSGELSHWTGRVEYLYVDVPKENTTLTGTPISGGSNNNILRIGMNYKF